MQAQQTAGEPQDRTATITDLPPIEPKSYLWGLIVSVTAACVIALTEIGAQSARVVGPDGRAWPFSVLFAGGDDAATGWRAIAAGGMLTGPDDALFQRLLWWHLGVDLVFMIAYGLLLAGLVHAAFRDGIARRVAYAAVAATVLADLVEDQLVAGLLTGAAPATVLPLLGWATAVKWFCLGGAVLAIVVRTVAPYSAPRPDDPRPTLRRIGRALMQHRFAVAFVVPLLVLSVLSGSAVLEQLPDVQRRWVTDGPDGQRQAQMAILALIVVAFLLAMLGRYRTGWARRHPTTPPPPPEEPGRPLLAIWVVGPVLTAIGALVTHWTMAAPVLVGRLLVFCLISLAVVGFSLLLRYAWRRHPERRIPDQPPQFDQLAIGTIRFTGHALALVALTIGGLGLIRSYMSMVILRPELVGPGAGLTAVEADRSTRFFALGVAGVVLPWLLSLAAALLARREVIRSTTSVGTTRPTSLWPRWLVLAAVLVTVVGVATHPGAVGRLGVSAVAIISLAALIGIAAAAGLLIQDRPTAEVFRFLGLKRTPLVSMLVLAVVAVGALSGQTTIHRIVDPAQRPSGPAPADARREPADRLVTDWLGKGGCVITVGGHQVRPMIMVAAEGGGIRAAYWTVKGLQALETGTAGKKGCGSHSVLFSAGASGGSVGLTVARFSGTPSAPGTDRAVAAVEEMARPDPLARGVVGTFVRDPLYGATGVPLPADGVAPARTWADRARLLEIGWSGGVDADSWGSRSFTTADDELSPATGPLILNSTSVANRCRVWISQVDLSRAPAATLAPAGGEQRCDGRDATGPRTIDLISAYTTAAPATPTAERPVPAGTEDCLHSLQSVTAAMLTARFPYVTPGGVVGPCAPPGGAGEGGWPRTQLIDGGYTENSGLATITDLSVSWLAQVRQHNEQAVRPGSTAPLIVPFVVFLSNEEGKAAQLRAPAPLQSEVLLPPIEFLRGQGTLNTTDALLQRAANAVRTTSICPDAATAALDCATIVNQLPRRVIVVDRGAQPEVTAPLGWVLSQASMTSLDQSMADAQRLHCGDASEDPACVLGYGGLGDLIGYLDRPAGGG